MQTIETGGSTFVYPLMSRWSAEYEQAHQTNVRYDYVGSGEGVRQMVEGELEFGCTDAPMTEAQLEGARKKRGEVVHIPLAHGAVVAAYNLPGVEGPLTLSGPVLTDIFLGKITRWDDRALRDLNPGVALPGEPIRLVARLDSSGTTFIFTDYLARVSPEFKAKVGAGKSPTWPAGLNLVKQPGNSGVSGGIKRTPYSLGYLELSQARDDGHAYARIRKEGAAIEATPATLGAAAQVTLAGKVPDDLIFSIANASGEGVYPISGTVWAVLYVKQKGEKGQRVKDFLRWATSPEGQKFATEMHYAPLAEVLHEPVKRKVDQITIY